MTLAELGQKMTNQEFELWVALAARKQEECPNCGSHASQLMEVHKAKHHCPVCGDDYHRIERVPRSGFIPDKDM